MTGSDPAAPAGSNAPTPADLDRLVCFDDFHDAARQALPPDAYDYYRSGALTEWTLAENVRAWRRWTFVRRSLVDVSQLDTSTTVLGTPVAFPVLVAPTAFHRLAAPEGEVATARAALSVDTIMVNSTLSTVSLEDVAATGAKRWFQLYVFKDRGITRELVDRAVAAGFTAIVPTVDAPTIGIRYADQRNRFVLPAGMDLATLGAALPATGASGLRAFSEQFDQTLTWRDLEWLVGLTDLAVVPKGIITGADARAALGSGAAGVIVSNHGGRQLDGDPATLDVLPEVVAAADGAGEVLVDGGVRTGADVVKAVALGASAVLVGRAVLWGLAAGGQAGVERVLGLVRDEVADTLRQLGVPRLTDIGPEVVRPALP
jgi:4-hydroxymandelate oxidase